MATNHSASLSVIADHLDRYHEQIGDLVPGFHSGSAGHGGQVAGGTSSDPTADVVIALVEAERALRTAARLVRRAARLADPSD